MDIILIIMIIGFVISLFAFIYVIVNVNKIPDEDIQNKIIFSFLCLSLGFILISISFAFIIDNNATGWPSELRENWPYKINEEAKTVPLFIYKGEGKYSAEYKVYKIPSEFKDMDFSSGEFRLEEGEIKFFPKE